MPAIDLKVTYVIHSRGEKKEEKTVTVGPFDPGFQALDGLLNDRYLSWGELKEKLPFDIADYGITITAVEF